MAKKLVIELPDDLERQLLAQAHSLSVSLESLILQSLAQSVNQADSTELEDPIIPLIGSLRLENSVIGEDYDHYLSQALQQELKVDE